MGRRTIRDSSSGGSLVPTKARGRIGEAGAGDGRERERGGGGWPYLDWTAGRGRGRGRGRALLVSGLEDGEATGESAAGTAIVSSTELPPLPVCLWPKRRRGARRNNRLAFDPVFITDGRSGPHRTHARANPPCSARCWCRRAGGVNAICR
ncbi:hypothetical protein BDA96_03G079900 [Sorghum bicolor]|uniref:Uncharacterized protein n=2 Tax=Sorghum bicolor TaxID=4558 RepID=A0A921RB13_SORBI|nr:hypothetical protein BDA96_03G079900 [Sorghum bicolor]KXG31916.1 hypothetical protein SORBI_3003G076300 [Sorghum bicolor]